MVLIKIISWNLFCLFSSVVSLVLRHLVLWFYTSQSQANLCWGDLTTLKNTRFQRRVSSSISKHMFKKYFLNKVQNKRPASWRTTEYLWWMFFIWILSTSNKEHIVAFGTHSCYTTKDLPRIQTGLLMNCERNFSIFFGKICFGF